MSDYYYSHTGKTRHAELVEQAHQDDLARELAAQQPRRPGPVARLLDRLSPRSGSASTPPEMRSRAVRHA